jgi:hypothetical protein
MGIDRNPIMAPVGTARLKIRLLIKTIEEDQALRPIFSMQPGARRPSCRGGTWQARVA